MFQKIEIEGIQIGFELLGKWHPSNHRTVYSTSGIIFRTKTREKNGGKCFLFFNSLFLALVQLQPGSWQH